MSRVKSLCSQEHGHRSVSSGARILASECQCLHWLSFCSLSTRGPDSAAGPTHAFESSSHSAQRSEPPPASRVPGELDSGSVTWIKRVTRLIIEGVGWSGGKPAVCPGSRVSNLSVPLAVRLERRCAGNKVTALLSGGPGLSPGGRGDAPWEGDRGSTGRGRKQPSDLGPRCPALCSANCGGS